MQKTIKVYYEKINNYHRLKGVNGIYTSLKEMEYHISSRINDDKLELKKHIIIMKVLK